MQLYVATPGGRHHYEKVKTDCWKIWIKPLKETNLGMAGALFDPQIACEQASSKGGKKIGEPRSAKKICKQDGAGELVNFAFDLPVCQGD